MERFISRISGAWLVFIIMFVEISEFNANGVDPDQMPRSAASDLGLHCLPVSLLWDAMLKWIKLETALLYFGLFQKGGFLKKENLLTCGANVFLLE